MIGQEILMEQLITLHSKMDFTMVHAAHAALIHFANIAIQMA